MSLLALATAAMRPAALVLLIVFGAACLVLLPRELSFIRGAGRGWQWRFVLQDALIIASILIVLLPCSLADKLARPMLYTVLGGFSLLWLAVLWAAGSRYNYVRQLLQQARDEGAAKLRASLPAPEDTAHAD